MSLLLDALKKAALEKQRREQPSNTQLSVQIPVAPSAPLTAPVQQPDDEKAAIEERPTNESSDENLSPEALELEELSIATVLIEEIPETPVDAEETAADIEETVLAFNQPKRTDDAVPVVSDEAVLAFDKDGLVFDIDEINLEPQANKILELGDSILVDKFTQPEAAQDHRELRAIEPSLVEPDPVEPPPIEKMMYEALHGQTEASRAEPTAEINPPRVALTAAPQEYQPESPANTEPSVEAFDAAAGKEALTKLLTRSKKAADFARKRLIVLYVFLSITAILLVAFYYYLVHSSSDSLVQSNARNLSPTKTGALAPTNTGTSTPTSPENLAPPNADGSAPTNSETNVLSPAAASEFTAPVTAGTETPITPVKLQEPPQVISNYPASQLIDQSDRLANPHVDQPNIDHPPVTGNHPMIVEHKPAEEWVSEAIARGYTAYQAGDFSRAGEAYREALVQDPHQRDALLGAAAVAVREGKQQVALGYYQQQLARNPKDEYAQAGILALSSASEQNPQLESELARLLIEYPDAAHLHFLQGSLYAARQQWAAAQIAFFEAWQRDNKNPDTAFNLAVALDQLGQPKEAARFYQQALSLGATRTVSFSTEAIERRLRVLSPNREGAPEKEKVPVKESTPETEPPKENAKP